MTEDKESKVKKIMEKLQELAKDLPPSTFWKVPMEVSIDEDEITTTEITFSKYDGALEYCLDNDISFDKIEEVKKL